MILFSKMCIFKIDTTIKCTRNTIKSKPSQKIIKMDNFVYSQVILYQTIVRLLETYNPKWNIAKRRDVRKNSSGGKIHYHITASYFDGTLYTHHH